MVPEKLEEKEEKEKPKETMKTHEVIKPQPRTLSSHSHWLNEKNNIMVKPIGTVSTKEVTAAKDRDDKETMVTNQIGRDCVDAMWWDSLLNLGEQECGEKEGSCSLFQENVILELPKVDDFFWDSKLCDIGSLWDL